MYYSLLTTLIILFNLNIINSHRCSNDCTTKADNGGASSDTNIRNISGTLQFAVTFEGFYPLVDREYWVRARRDARFQENVSVSMYRYYMSQHLYARLAMLRAKRGLADATDEKFADHLLSLAPILPTATYHYLTNLGDVTARMTTYSLSFPIWPNEEGHFGRVNRDNHWQYMAFPAPAVVAQAVQEDLRRSSGPSDPRAPHWNLNSDMTPLSENYHYPGYPTVNLLGWKPAVLLTLSQRQTIEASGVDVYYFDALYSRFKFNPQLVEIIHEYFRDCEQATVNTASDLQYQKLVGMTRQLSMVRRAGGSGGPFSRSIASIDHDVEGFLHPSQEDTLSAKQRSLIVAFRVDKGHDTSDDWCVYDWGEYENVPQSWKSTRNTLFEDYDDVGANVTVKIEFSAQRGAVRSSFLHSAYRGEA